MLRVYLETSFLSACVTTRSDARSTVWKQTSLRWWAEQAPWFEICVSAEVIRELSSEQFEAGRQALALVAGVRVLPLTPETQDFADMLVQHRVMPGPSSAGDALHVACATVNHVEFILSWNIGHLANVNKRTHLAVICARANLRAPAIVTPDMLQWTGGES